MPAHLAAATTTTMPDVSVGHALVQMVIALLVIVACIYGLSKVLARMRNGAARSARSTRGGRREATAGLTVLSRQPLGKDLSIAAVRWGEREVLVGIAGSTITFLNEPGVDAPPRAGADEPSATANTDVSALLARALAERTPVGAGAGTGSGRVKSSLLDTLRDATLRR